MPIAHVKNWKEFQHYKDRSPPWIKLHRGLLDDFNYTCLPLASKALAPLVWLLAAESNDGSVNVDPGWLAFRLRWRIEDINDGLTPLIDKGFLLRASESLADCSQLACPEGEREREGEREGESRTSRKRKPKTAESTFSEWANTLTEDAVPANDPIFSWAERQGIPRDWVAIAWWVFEGRYEEKNKTYADWRAVFRNAVKEDWLKVWRLGRDGGWELTTAGVQAQKEMAHA